MVTASADKTRLHIVKQDNSFFGSMNAKFVFSFAYCNVPDALAGSVLSAPAPITECFFAGVVPEP